MSEHWNVYRDGGCWSAYAPDLHTALIYATPERAKPIVAEIGRGKASLFMPDAEPPKVDLQAPTLLVLQQRYGFAEAVLWVWQTGDRTLRVDRSLSVTFDVAVAAVLRCADVLANVPELQQIYVARYKTGKRVGQLRFTDHTDMQRRELLAIDAANQASHQARDAATANLNATFDVLISNLLSEPPPNITLAGVQRWADQLQAVRKVTPYRRADVLAWLNQGQDALTEVRATLESVHDHGFPIGAVCHVPRDPHAGADETSPFGRCTVIGARVWRDGKMVVHSREIEDQAGREWDCTVMTMREGPPPSE